MMGVKASTFDSFLLWSYCPTLMQAMSFLGQKVFLTKVVFTHRSSYYCSWCICSPNDGQESTSWQKYTQFCTVQPPINREAFRAICFSCLSKLVLLGRKKKYRKPQLMPFEFQVKNWTSGKLSKTSFELQHFNFIYCMSSLINHFQVNFQV